MNRRRWLKHALLGATGALLGAEPPGARAAPAARIVVIGGGFAGSTFALRLRRQAPQHQILLVDRTDPYTTCPGSNEVIAGLRQLSALQVHREGLRRAGVLCARDEVDGIDAPRRRVLLRGGAQLPYDRLVLSPGIRFLWERIEGAGPETPLRMPNAWAAGEQTVRLAGQLRQLPAGGVVVISVPAGPMRCPPGPYERASLMAHFLKAHKPRAKLIILDANNSFPRLPQFMQAWQQFYPGLIEWIPVTQGGALERIDTQRMLLYAGAGAIHADLANVIPPQAPDALAPATGLAAPHGWCPVQPESFESTLIPGIHVIGDACIADDMPKSGSAAMSQAGQCAAAIQALLADRTPPSARFESVCYARVSPERALSIPARFSVEEGRITAQRGATPVSGAIDARAADRWYARARAEAFAD